MKMGGSEMGMMDCAVYAYRERMADPEVRKARMEQNFALALSGIKKMEHESFEALLKLLDEEGSSAMYALAAAMHKEKENA